MNILIVTQWFNPEPNNMKALVFAKGLQNLGNNVQILTGHPNYPTGELYDGYKLKLFQRETMDGVIVNRVRLYPSHDSNKRHRVRNYISFCFYSTLIGPWVIEGKIDVVYVYHPPITSFIPAYLIKLLRRAKIILDVNDLWPDTLKSTGMINNESLIRLVGKMCDRAYKKADRINVLSSGIQQLLIERGVPKEKVSVIPVWCNEQIVTKERNLEFWNTYNCDGKFTAIYAGAIGPAQDLISIVKAAATLKKVMPTFSLFIIGSGVCVEELRAYIDENNIDNVILLPSVPAESIASILNCADVLVVHLKKNDLFKVTIPSKIPFYMALKKPIVAGLEGDAARIIRDSNGGVVCEPGNITDITRAFTTVFNMKDDERNVMAQNGFDYYLKHLSMQSGIKQFNDMFYDCIK